MQLEQRFWVVLEVEKWSAGVAPCPLSLLLSPFFSSLILTSLTFQLLPIVTIFWPAVPFLDPYRRSVERCESLQRDRSTNGFWRTLSWKPRPRDSAIAEVFRQLLGTHCNSYWPRDIPVWFWASQVPDGTPPSPSLSKFYGDRPSIVDAESVNTFKTRLDKYCSDQPLLYDFKAELAGTGDRTKCDIEV